jgi:hypothetical protein
MLCSHQNKDSLLFIWRIRHKIFYFNNKKQYILCDIKIYETKKKPGNRHIHQSSLIFLAAGSSKASDACRLLDVPADGEARRGDLRSSPAGDGLLERRVRGREPGGCEDAGTSNRVVGV